MKKIFLLIAQLIALTNFAYNSYAQNSDDAIPLYQITSTRLDNSRNQLSTITGSSSYSFSRKDIENLPAGSVTSLNQVLLQAPGVTQDSYGQFHIRDDHSNLQYRINGVILPEGIGGFGQILDSNFIEHADLITGALPAQYGYRTAGIIDIKTKSGQIANANRTQITSGSHNTIGANQEFNGSKGKYNYYLNASYLQNDLGVAAPTAGSSAIHDFTRQDKEFGSLSYLLDDTTRLSIMLSNATNRFQIPDNPGQSTQYQLQDYSGYSSSDLNQKQNEYNRFAIAALQGITDLEIDYQLAVFTRQSKVIFNPDYAGDLMFNGVASYTNNQSLTAGIQNDLSYQLNKCHTLRGGFNFISDETKNETDTAVFSTGEAGNQLSDVPFNIPGYNKKNSYLYGLYIEDEWRASEKLTINYGARYDISQSYVNASQFSPRFGAIYDFNKRTKIHAGYARYFTPAPTEMITNESLSQFQNTTNAPNNLVNDQVRPERTNYYDAGVIHKLNAYANIGLDAYYKEVRDMLDEGQFGQALIYTPFNYQQGKVYGLELIGDYRRDNFSAYVNFAVSKAKAKNIVSGQYLFDDGELSYIADNYVKPDHDQRYTASAGVSYLFYRTDYNINAIYGSGMRKGFANTEHLPYYIQVNLGALREFILPGVGKIAGRFSIINLFDESYQIRDGSGIGVGAPQYGPRRAYYLTISKSF